MTEQAQAVANEPQENAVSNPPQVAPQPEAQEAPQQPSAEHVSLIAQAKDRLLQELAMLYQAFIAHIHKVPLHPAAKQKAFGHFDDGALWLHEGVRAMSMNPEDLARAQAIGGPIPAEPVVEPAPAVVEPIPAPAVAS